MSSPAENTPASAGSNADRFPASELPDAELSELIRSWQQLLQRWAGNGRLSRAAQIALNLPADHPGLRDLVAQIAGADFSELPTILVLDWEAMEGSACAYAPEQRLILINREWQENAVAEQVYAVLTDELGHHLDVLFNPADTPGDEGELFLECLRAGDPSVDTRASCHNEEATGVVHLHGETIAVEEAGVGAFCLDLRDLPHPAEPPPA